MVYGLTTREHINMWDVLFRERIMNYENVHIRKIDVTQVELTAIAEEIIIDETQNGDLLLL